MSSMYSLNFYENVYWIINLFVFLCNCHEISSESCKQFALDKGLPDDWPCHWNNGVIPYAFNFYSQSPKRLVNLVKRGHEHLEKRSCLKFKEVNPVKLANMPNVTYLYYTYSGVLENCCLDFYTKPYGRRLVLLTPMCTMSLEIAHVTLHGLGLWHQRQKSFPEAKARAILFPTEDCPNMAEKMESYDGGLF